MGICDSANSKTNINYSNNSFEKEDNSMRKETKVNSNDLSNEKIRKSINHKRSLEKKNQIEKNESQSSSLKKKGKKTQ